jgi:hypothetical protein
MKRIASLFLITSLFMAACSQESSVLKEKQHIKNATATVIKDEITTDLTQSNKNTNKSSPKDSTANNAPDLRTDGKWMQAGRLYFLQGTVTNLQKETGENSTVSILVENTIIGAGGIAEPYKLGKIHSFHLFKNPKTNLLHHKVMLLVGPMTINDPDLFEGAVFFYIWRNGQFVDEQGQKAVLPPTEKDWHYLEELQKN